MPVNKEAYLTIKEELDKQGVSLVAVSKTKPVEDILALYELGHRDFGENYVQELTSKAGLLPKDIRWHFIGHLQSNKVRQIAPFVHLVHGVDSLSLLKEINKQAAKNNRAISCLLQIHIAKEETKFGLDAKELDALLTLVEKDAALYSHVLLHGLMGMASFSDDDNLVRSEFRGLKNLFDKCRMETTTGRSFSILSMGMSSDYKTAVNEGSTMVRIGSLLFGQRG
ncbi:MAG: YggS family pyridoxal phosphate-dependent enzyme [Chitinophagaceae bacterium]|nr:YggS family pyridoxal phosphate-dependent enzyme [Chitinophagaceae bacterium]